MKLRDGLRQHLEVLDTAEILLENKRFSHVCYLFQGSAEKALKAL
jgi:HEPN domain-containing protein